MYLHQLKLNTKAKIVKINLGHSVRERLHSMGVIEGIDIVPRKKVPLRGPRIYEIMNTSLAIRNDIARKIQIKTPNEKE